MHLPALWRLCLSSDIKTSTVEALAPCLGLLTGLEDLDLSGNSIWENGLDEGATLLALGLRTLMRLKYLSLANTDLCVDGVATLAPSLGLLTGLLKLDLSRNQMGDDGAAALSPSLGLLTGLVHLDLSHNIMSDEGVLALAHRLSALPALRCLRLFNDPLGEDAAAAAQALCAVINLVP